MSLAVRPGAPYARIMATGRTILVVEDEPLIAMMLEDLLDTLGHRVAGNVDSVEDALGHVEAGGFDLVVLDVNLRGGEECWPVADALADRGIAFLLASGGGAELPPVRHRQAPILSKPFTMADLERAISEV